MSIGRNDYAERREARVDRLEASAAKAQAESSAAYRTAREIMDGIPFGQPVLVGHHSERGHRNMLNRIDQNMRKSVAAEEKAQYYQDRAAAAAGNSAISSDDPDAIDKLKDKLARLEAAQAQDKARNAYYRKHKTMKGCDGISDEEAVRVDAELLEMREAIRRPVSPWHLSNRNAEINRLKKRIAALERVDEMEHVEIDFDGGKIVTNEDINRVQILFDEKPGEEVRKELKRWGFRWSPREGAWQTARTPGNLLKAKRICHV